MVVVAAAAFNGMSVEKRLAEKAVSKDVGPSVGAPSFIAGHLLMTIKYLRSECESYTAHQLKQ